MSGVFLALLKLLDKIDTSMEVVAFDGSDCSQQATVNVFKTVFELRRDRRHLVNIT